MTVDGERLVCNVMVTNGYKNQKSFTQFRVVVKGATSGRKSFNFAVEDYNKAETVTKAALLVRNAMAEKAVAS